jgi:hypothetical protein
MICQIKVAAASKKDTPAAIATPLIGAEIE